MVYYLKQQRILFWTLKKVYSLFDYPEIQECFIMPFSLKSGVITFLIKNEMRETFENRVYNALGNDFCSLLKMIL